MLPEMVLIPGGTFLMGSPKGVGDEDERPQHEVHIVPFLMGKYPVTQAQWEAIMGPNPFRFKGPQRPVENVTWYDAQAFCEQLTRMTGEHYRLPGEAEWEYACRAGTTATFHFGDTITTELANFQGEFTEPPGLYRHVTTDVGQFPPNAFGLFDMHGNVWEWCADPWHDNYEGAPVNGSVWEGNSLQRVVRGGSWHDPPDACRSATRVKFVAAEGDDFIGFRVARTIWRDL